MLSVSLSAVQAFQRCEALYGYRYVRRLKRPVKDIAPERGILIHEYLAAFYDGTRLLTADDAHAQALKVIDDYRPDAELAAQTAYMMGDEDVAKEYYELPNVVTRIMERYYATRGRIDATQYEVILVEEHLRDQLLPGIQSRSVVDLVLRDRNLGRIHLVEHKSTKNVPGSAVHIRDLQTLLYASVLRHRGRANGERINIDSVLWNYIRTKEPDVPHMNKDGKLSRSIGCDTTWERYKQAAIDAGQNPERYEDMRLRLEGREETIFFPRYEHILVASPDILLRDYAVTATRIRQRRLEWEKGLTVPVRTLERACDYCEFYRVCEAALVGGDEEDVIRMRFIEDKS